MCFGGNHCAGRGILQCRYRPCRSWSWQRTNQLILAPAKKKQPAYFGSRREQINLFWVSQRTNHLILGLVEKQSAYLGSRREKISLFWVLQRNTLLILGLAKNKSACFGAQAPKVWGNLYLTLISVDFLCLNEVISVLIVTSNKILAN